MSPVTIPVQSVWQIPSVVLSTLSTICATASDTQLESESPSEYEPSSWGVWKVFTQDPKRVRRRRLRRRPPYSESRRSVPWSTRSVVVEVTVSTVSVVISTTSSAVSATRPRALAADDGSNAIRSTWRIVWNSSDDHHVSAAKSLPQTHEIVRSIVASLTPIDVSDKADLSEFCVLLPASQASVGAATTARTDSVRSSIPVVSRSSNPLDDDDDDEY